jgi:iron complex outermembrane recepter protein
MARTLLVCAFVCLALTLPPPAAAQASRTKEYPLDISRQPLTRALEQLNKQTNLLYAYIPASSEEEQQLVGPLKGNYQIDQALTELLRSTELTFEWTAGKNVSIVRRPPAPKPPPPPAKQPRAGLRDKQHVPEQESREDEILEQVVTTWRSRFRSLPAPSTAGFVFDRKLLERTGLSTVGDLMLLIPQQPFLRPDGFRTNGAQYAELRGLGPDTTLVLISGRRAFASAASYQVNAFDLNQLPLSAVERVEVQLDSISVRHGADAIGGIVNIVLRDNVDDPSIEIRHGAAAGGGEQDQASISAGYRGDNVVAALIVDYRELSPLFGVERDLWRDQDYRRFGGPDLRSPLTSPGNVFGMPLIQSIGAPFAAIPEHTRGSITEPDEFRPFDLNRGSLFQYVPIIAGDRRASAVANINVTVNEWLGAAADLMFVDRSVLFDTLPPVINALVPQTNPYNRLSQPVLFTGFLNGADPTRVSTDSSLVRGSGSLSGKVREWNWELTLLRSEEDAEVRLANVIDPDNPLDMARLAQALNNPDLDGTLNLLGPGPAASREVLAAVVGPPDVDTLATDATQLTGAVNGRLFETRAGKVEMILGTEWRKEAVKFDSLFGAFEREVAGGFAEVEVPLLGDSIHFPGARELTLTLAGRFDRYTDFGEIFSPQYGLVWRPFRDVAVRATYGRSFRAPSLYELYLPDVLATTQIVDPRRNETYGVLQLASGTPDLEATRGESFAAGIEFTPEAVSTLKLSATYWHVVMDDRVIALNPLFAVRHESAFADRVLRADPTAAELAAGRPGRIVHIDSSRLNLGRLETSGIDAGANYEFDVAANDFTVDVKATWIGKYESLDLPGERAVDRVNVANSLGTIAKWRAITSLDWQRGPLNATAYVRYIPSYDDTREGVRNGRTIHSQTFLDLQFSLDFGKLMEDSKLLRGVEFSAGALNVLDELPDYAEVNGVQGYDTSQGDLKGRFWYLRLGKSF